MVTQHSYGFREEPDNPGHWGFESLLKGKLVPLYTGDVDLRPFASPRHDQLFTGSCVAQATCSAFEMKRIQKYGHDQHVDLSRLAVYWFARNLMVPKETSLDEGTYISHAFDAMRRFGCPPESAHPWDPRKLLYTPPGWDAMRQAFVSRINSFYKIRTVGDARIENVIEALRAGNPVVFGCNVNQSWHRYEKGDVLRPVSYDNRTGRHATCLVGYKDGLFIGENSWGSSWGDDGFYLMDPSVISHVGSADFWVPQAGWESYAEQQEGGV